MPKTIESPGKGKQKSVWDRMRRLAFSIVVGVSVLKCAPHLMKVQKSPRGEGLDSPPMKINATAINVPICFTSREMQAASALTGLAREGRFTTSDQATKNHGLPLQ